MNTNSKIKTTGTGEIGVLNWLRNGRFCARIALCVVSGVSSLEKQLASQMQWVSVKMQWHPETGVICNSAPAAGDVRISGIGQAFSAVLNKDFKLPADGWFQLIPFGEVKNAWEDADGELHEINQVFDREALDFIVSNFKPGVLIDFEHDSTRNDRSSRAAGWIEELQLREDGLYYRPKWSASGRAAIEGGDYRFISPTFLIAELIKINDDTYRPTRLDSAGLTNVPAIRGQKPISNDGKEPSPTNQNQNRKETMKAIAAELGKAESATEAELVAEIQVIKNRASKADDLKKENDTLKNSQVEADLKEFGGVITNDNREFWKSQLINNREETRKVLSGMKPGEGADGDKPTGSITNRNNAKQPEGEVGKKAGNNEAVLNSKVRSYQETHKVSYKTAYEAIVAQHPELIATEEEK